MEYRRSFVLWRIYTGSVGIKKRVLLIAKRENFTLANDSNFDRNPVRGVQLRFRGGVQFPI